MKGRRAVAAGSVVLVLLMAMTVVPFSRGDSVLPGPASFRELLSVGDRVVVSYLGQTIQLTVVTNEAFWTWTGRTDLPLQRGVVTGVFPDYVRVRIERQEETLAPAGTVVVAHFPYHAIHAVNVYVRD